MINSVNPFTDPEFKKQILEKEGKTGYDEGWRGDLKLCKRYSCK